MSCHSPIPIETKTGMSVPVPCGKCAPCKRRRVESWVFRVMQEYKVSASAYFVTLTYDTPYVPRSANGFLTLRKSDVQKFMKRLRKATSAKMKYYLCGEYGSKNRRPHYHLILFNCPSKDLIEQSWGLGYVHIDEVNGNTVAYTMKYIDKSEYIKRFSRDDRIPEFSLMSKGIGKNFLSPAMVDYYHSDVTRMHVTERGGKKIAIPRYYRKKLFDEDQLQEQLMHVQSVMLKKADESKVDYLRLYGDNSQFTYSDYLTSRQKGYEQNYLSNFKPRSL